MVSMVMKVKCMTIISTVAFDDYILSNVLCLSVLCLDITTKFLCRLPPLL